MIHKESQDRNLSPNIFVRVPFFAPQFSLLLKKFLTEANNPTFVVQTKGVKKQSLKLVNSLALLYLLT